MCQIVLTCRTPIACRICYNLTMTEKKKPDQSKISLAPLTFEEALDAFLRTPPMPKEPKPKKDGSEKDKEKADG